MCRCVSHVSCACDYKNVEGSQARTTSDVSQVQASEFPLEEFAPRVHLLIHTLVHRSLCSRHCFRKIFTDPAFCGTKRPYTEWHDSLYMRVLYATMMQIRSGRQKISLSLMPLYSGCQHVERIWVLAPERAVLMLPTAAKNTEVAHQYCLLVRRSNSSCLLQHYFGKLSKYQFSNPPVPDSNVSDPDKPAKKPPYSRPTRPHAMPYFTDAR